MRGGLFTSSAVPVGRISAAALRAIRSGVAARVIRRSRAATRAAAEEADGRLLIGRQRQRVVDVADRAGHQARSYRQLSAAQAPIGLVEACTAGSSSLELLIVIDPEVAGALPPGGSRRFPGGEKIALVCAITTNALNPSCSTRLTRPVKPSIFEWSQEIGNTIGVSNSTPKS